MRVQIGPNGESIPRLAQDDVELRGISIRAGERAVASIEAANHDPSVFTNPDGSTSHAKTIRISPLVMGHTTARVRHLPACF
jgi:hypothetical protein